MRELTFIKTKTGIIIRQIDHDKNQSETFFPKNNFSFDKFTELMQEFFK